jgi:hypothetical protein
MQYLARVQLEMIVVFLPEETIHSVYPENIFVPHLSKLSSISESKLSCRGEAFSFFNATGKNLNLNVFFILSSDIYAFILLCNDLTFSYKSIILGLCPWR